MAAVATWALAVTIGVSEVPTSWTDVWIRIAQGLTLLAMLGSVLPVRGLFRS